MDLDMFQSGFLDWLRDFRFSGELYALPEGTPVFPQEPFLEVEAPIAEAQLLESLVMNYVHLESVLASKSVRLVQAAEGVPVVDFGMRRMHGADSAYRGTRAYRLAALAGTSNVLAGQDFGLKVSGTMAHSFIQSYDNEMEAFKTYARLYPDTVLLVDTYDTETAVKNIIKWLKEDSEAKISAIRLDSGDLGAEAKMCRKLFDEAGMKNMKILASGGLDEYEIRDLVEDNAPIDGFGVGTSIGTARDSPSIDLAYKLTAYADKPRMKISTGKKSYPGRKQVYRHTDSEGNYLGDTVTLREEKVEGKALLEPVMRAGNIVSGAIKSLDDMVESAKQAVEKLPSALRSLDEPAQKYSVKISDKLEQLQSETEKKVRGAQD